MIRVGRAAENMLTLRRLALNLAKGEKSLKIGVAAKAKESGLGFGVSADDTPTRAI